MPAKFVGPQVVADGLSPNDADRTTRLGAKVVSQLHGQYFEQNSRGRVYTGCVGVAGIALITTAVTGNHPTLWNPSDSGRTVNVICLTVQFVSGTMAPGGLSWYSTLNTGAAVATGAPILTFTQVAVATGILGGPSDNKAKWAPAINTFTAAPAYFRPTGLAMQTAVTTGTGLPWLLEKKYDGDLALAPGTALSLCSVQATTTALFQVSVTWEEVDV